MREIDIGDSYLGAVLPAVVVFGLGLALVVAPITATVLAAADERHAGMASGVNNAVARTAQLAAVAVLPLIAGMSGNDYQDPQALADGFRTAMLASAVLLSAAGSLLAWLSNPGRRPESGAPPTATPRIGRRPTSVAVSRGPLCARRERPAARPSTKANCHVSRSRSEACPTRAESLGTDGNARSPP